MKRSLLLITAISCMSWGFKDTPKPMPSHVQQKLLELTLRAIEEHKANTVGEQTVTDYEQLPDSLKNIGGLCFKVARKRIDEAFVEVTGKPLYGWLPKTMATKYLTARQVFDWTWNINTQDNQVWRSMPDLRACGSAGAMKMAGLGDLKGTTQIWSGELLPGAVVQAFMYVADFEKVRYGIDDPKLYDNLSGYGHSFIFLEYVYDEYGEITGMKVADQGFMSKIVVNKATFNIWWGANILDPK
ncbi:MAG: hypothetical protein JSU05_00695 [Bacteroidetes bacterium]|nr:hypothetical protein [Bacteroidota bacterium]